ncbi:hypothetical protein SAMD00019534_020520 [Acytostelium subglobosum LB1]|uniref:hypothetical protein n=1 Tax=Acytostelium subglobosum LB1 TaxID=1410327 RepID=UPI0006448660|nr:hypothetical protein SAMD00019534_020520 [Acytostelium subglobosum LB1]GAM18877.1 hypothetical protein SAMD00019534_020520 [Acytostelium subglobosum LB1]|eukprot:XP_012758097.1 hypothetical protein SAMD00019534_020520 [Acytostelium subglobosum LB1]
MEEMMYGLEMTRLELEHKRQKANMMTKLHSLLAEKKALGKQEPFDADRLQYIDEQI